MIIVKLVDKRRLIYIHSRISDLAKDATAGLQPTDQVRVNNVVNSNLNKLKTAPKVIMEAFEMQGMLCEKLTLMIQERFKQGDLLNHVQTIGRQAHRGGVYDPKKVIMSYWPEEDRISHRK